MNVMQAGSISEAARIMGLPRATLSRRMARLEADLGVRLILRRTTKLALTHAGEELLRRAKRVVADADEAWDAVRRLDDTPRGLLRVSMAGSHFLTLFTDFLCDFPEVRLEVQSTTRHVDLLAESVDVAMRIGPVKDQDLIARRLHTDRLIVVAAPEYLNRMGTPQKATDLTKHICIVGFAGEWTPNNIWPLWKGGTISVGGRLSANEIGLIREAAIEGSDALSSLLRSWRKTSAQVVWSQYYSTRLEPNFPSASSTQIENLSTQRCASLWTVLLR